MRNLSAVFIVIFCLMWLPAQAQTIQQGKAKPSKPRMFRDCPGCPEMVVIPAGNFAMGSPGTESGRDKNEDPLHPVKIATFALGKTEITRGQFAAFVKKTKYNPGDKCWTYADGKFAERIGNWRKPGYAQNDKHPVACINWEDAQAYVQWLSRRTGKKYRLPTEAEWEYAARANTSTARYWGESPDAACHYANVADQTAQAQIQGAPSWVIHDCADGFAYTAMVGILKANAFGLHDMLGNLWEWAADGYHDSYEGSPADGKAWQSDGSMHVLRGGSWNSAPRDVRAAIRNNNKPTLRFSIFGFRIARVYP